MLKKKILLLFGIISVFIIITTSIVMAFNLKNNIFQLIQKEQENQLNHIDFAIHSIFSEVVSDVETLAMIDAVRTRDDSEFTNFLNADEETFQYNIGSVEKEIIDIFNSYRMAHPYISSVYMGRENGSFVRSHKRASPTRYDPRERPWYIIARENPDKVVRTEPYRSVTTPDVNIGIEKALVDENGEVFGVVGMDITLENLTDYISTIQVGQNGWAILVSEDGTILASRNDEDLMKNIRDYGQKNLEIFMEEPQGYTTFDTGTGQNYLFFHTSYDPGWKIGLIIPVKEINYWVWTSILKNILILVFSLLLLGFLMLIGLQKFVLNPLKKLSEDTALIAATGNLEHSIMIKSRDEIGNLAGSFNKMMESINRASRSLRNSEKELRELNEKLEERVKERTRELDRANIQLKELDHLKSMFIASMSHELRTPLNSIIGFTSLILKGMAGKITGEQKKQLLMVKSSANHLLELITDVIDVSKIEADQIDLYIEDFNLTDILQEIRDSFKVFADMKKLILVVDAPEKLAIRSDSRRVRQIIMNFTSNAVKFTGKGKIEIKAEEKGGKARISVSDSGVGIRKEDTGRLFKQFSRIHTEGTPIAEGTGLGLYLSKKMADLLGGRVDVKSIFGKGSTFTLILPLQIKQVKNEKDSDNRR